MICDSGDIGSVEELEELEEVGGVGELGDAEYSSLRVWIRSSDYNAHFLVFYMKSFENIGMDNFILWISGWAFLFKSSFSSGNCFDLLSVSVFEFSKCKAMDRLESLLF